MVVHRYPIWGAGLFDLSAGGKNIGKTRPYTSGRDLIRRCSRKRATRSKGARAADFLSDCRLRFYT